MPEIRNVAGTAFIIAEFRAEENRAATPLYTDPYVGMYLDAETRALAETVVESFPLAKEMVKLRTRFFDDEVNRALDDRFMQVAILGAGLDTRSLRLTRRNVIWYENDVAETIAYKRDKLAELKNMPKPTLVPGDYVAEGAAGLLAGAGLDFARPVFVLWEGNTTYLTLEQLRAVLGDLHGAAESDLRVAFDFMSDKVITRQTGHADLDAYIDHLHARGAPWVSGIDDPAAFLDPLGFRVRNHLSAAELGRRYCPDRDLDSALFDHYFVACAEKTG